MPKMSSRKHGKLEFADEGKKVSFTYACGEASLDGDYEDIGARGNFSHRAFTEEGRKAADER